ncbi:MAG: aspartyl protease family protein [bacterium]
MRLFKKRWVRVLVITVALVAGLTGAGYLYLQHMIARVMSTLTGCRLESENFRKVVGFDYDSGWIVVKARVNGSEQVFDFILDTGAQTVFSDSLFRQLGIDDYDKVSVETDTAKHAFKNEIVAIESLELGEVKFSDVGALVVEGSEYDMLNCISPYGIIGYNVLQTCCFQIDYQNEQLLITDRPDSLQQVDDIEWLGYTTSGQETPVIPATINDTINVSLTFDTGYRGFMSLSSGALYEAIGSQYPSRIAKFAAKPTLTITNNRDVEPYQKLLFKTTTLTIGSNETKDMVVSVGNIRGGDQGGLIGSKYFEDYIITLDYANKRVGFLPNPGGEERERESTFGLSYAPLGGKVTVSALYEGSEAERLGIRVGDEVLSINGTTVSSLDSEDLCKIFRGESDLVTKTDSVLALSTIGNGEVIRCVLERYELF